MISHKTTFKKCYAQMFEAVVDKSGNVFPCPQVPLKNYEWLAYGNVKEKPFLGYGTGSFGTIFNREVKSGHKFHTHTTPHNNYLYVWFELGIMGIVLLLSIFYFQIRELIVLKNGFHRIILPLMFMTIMLVDSYFFIFILTAFYIYFYTIYNRVNLDKLS